MATTYTKPIVLITGATGNLGLTLAKALSEQYQIVGFDREVKTADFPVIEADFTSKPSIALALHKFRDQFGSHIASVIH